MHLGRAPAAVVATAVVWALARPAAQPKPPITVDDLMKLRSIVDVQIAPDGQRVAYVVSTPNLVRNEHDAALFVVAATGGAAARLGEGVRIFNVPTPRPQLRWSPDGSMLSVIGIEDGRPEVIGIPLSGAPPEALTRAPEGAFTYEWSPDGSSLAFLTRDPMPREEERQRQEKSFILPRRCARSPDPAGAAEGRPAIRAPHADAAGRVRRRAVVVARRPRNRVLGGATRRLHGGVRRPRVRGRTRGRRPPHHRRSRRHEHRSPLFAGREVDRLHLDQRPQRHHGLAQPHDRRGGRRHAKGLHPRRCVGERVRVVARQPIDPAAGQRRHLRPRRSHVRTAGRQAFRRRWPRHAHGIGPDRRLLDQPRHRRDAAGVQVGRRAEHGRRRGDGCGQRASHDDYRREPRFAPLRARRSQTGEMALVRRHGDLGTAADAVRRAGGEAAADARLHSRRPGRRLHARPVPAVHAHRAAGGSVSHGHDGGGRLRDPVPDAARRRRLRRRPGSARSSTAGATPTTRTSWPASTR